jgi:hypothetical protein
MRLASHAILHMWLGWGGGGVLAKAEKRFVVVTEPLPFLFEFTGIGSFGSFFFAIDNRTHFFRSPIAALHNVRRESAGAGGLRRGG